MIEKNAFISEERNAYEEEERNLYCLCGELKTECKDLYAHTTGGGKNSNIMSKIKYVEGYKIESGIPVPVKYKNKSLLLAMEVGQSAVVNHSELQGIRINAKKMGIKIITNKLSSNSYRFWVQEKGDTNDC